MSKHHSITPALPKSSPADTSIPAASRFGVPILTRYRVNTTDGIWLRRWSQNDKRLGESEPTRNTRRRRSESRVDARRPVCRNLIVASFWDAVFLADALAMEVDGRRRLFGVVRI
jgi:hypothetical protein